MTAYYPLLTLASILVFAGLGRYLAKARNRNGLVWAVAAALLPPVLIILLLLRPLTAEEAAENAGEDTDEAKA